MLTTDLMNLPRTRAAAAAQGSTLYFTNKACHKGHLRHRYTASGTCAGCAYVRYKEVGAGYVSPESRTLTNKKWNASNKAAEAKAKWKQKDPKRAWATYAVSGAKQRAYKTGVPFDLSNAFVRSIIPDVCPVFKTPFTFIGGKKMRLDSPTLDRIRPELGYVVGNVAVISAKANAIKSSATVDEIQAVADWLRNY
jgi:hypothetical protein